MIRSAKRNKGITLIALVITIIVLLILAGVTIASLSGDNGILTRGKEAKEKNNEATAKEEIQLEIMGSFDNNGNYNSAEAKNNIEKNLKNKDNELLVTENSGILNIRYKNQEIVVDKNGKVYHQEEYNNSIVDYSKAINVKVNGIDERITKENISQYIGRKVEYMPENANLNYGTSKTYRILNVDFDNKYKDGSGTIYIKADADNKKIDISDKNISGIDSSYTIPLEGKEKFEKLNPLLGLIPEGDDTTNKKYCTWLANPQNWIGYKDKKIKQNINYVVGAPCLEMIVDSYNIIHNDDQHEYTKTSFGYRISNYGNFKYNENSIFTNSQDYSYFLLSPSENNGGSMEYSNMTSYCFLVKNNKIIPTSIIIGWSEKASICPVVSISPKEILNLEL